MRRRRTLKSEPLKNEKCGRDVCFPCETGGGKCEKNGGGYEVVCVTCQRAGRKTCYYGESGKNGYDKESGEGYKSVPLCHQNSDASQDALKLVPDSSF